MSNEIETLKAQIRTLERRVRELESRSVLSQRHETLMGMAVEGLRHEMNHLGATVNGMDAMVKEHDVHVYLLMTRKSNQTKVDDEPKRRWWRRK